MGAGEVPNDGAVHPESASGEAYNGNVGLGLAELVLEIIAGHAGVRTICDLGCGNGYLAGQLGTRGYKVLGIDASATYIKFARERHGGPLVQFEQALIDHDLASRLLSTTAPFGLVVSSDVIEHLYNPLAFLEAAHMMLRPGGTEVIGTPYHGYLKNLAISLTGKSDAHHGVHWHGGHIKFFSPASLRNMLLAAGFSEPAAITEDSQVFGRT